MSASGFTTFTYEEYKYITRLLRSVFEIRTADGEEDEVLGDFIAALEDGDTISPEAE